MKPDLSKNLLTRKTSIIEKPISILLVEDNPGDVLIIRELLKTIDLDFSLKTVSTLQQTLLLCIEQAFDIILLDLGLPDSVGMETLKKIQVFSVKSPVVVMTGLDDEDIALESLREGAQDYLVKNRLTPDILLRGIRHSIERKKTLDLLQRNARQFSLLSSTSAALNECEDTDTIYSVACRNISQLLDNAGTLAFDLKGAGIIHMSGIESLEPWYGRIYESTGLDLKKPVQNVHKPVKEMTGLFRDGKLHKINTISHVAQQSGADSGAFRLEQLHGGLHLYAIGFIRKNTVYGGALIFAPEPVGFDDAGIIEAVSYQVSLTIHKMTIEMDLKAGETRYRKLNRELEQKVKERTRDLEHSNYMLNQELIERHVAEEALKNSEARLKELVATKDKFFSIIAHDLKNPFTSMLGSAELLNGCIGKLNNSKVMRLVQILNDSAKSGYSILQNLLDWSRSQTGMIKFNPDIINLKPLIDENISDMRPSSGKKRIKIRSEIGKDLYAYTDKNIICAILRNLLGNAVKFTHRSGMIIVSASCTSDEIRISVKDSGIGIPEEKQQELFRIDSDYRRIGTGKEQGTGIGLKLCREFVELQGGKIWVESIVNKGSNFIFSVPLSKESVKRG